ncbi:MAG: anhydro-N-acetylmuramic acid kinase [Candidatus Flexifilum sp.]|jgi:anhydro-N-acetylmuramic acid kinase
MRIVGLMSGTSADAIDAALCAIDGQPPQLEARIVQAITYPYPDGFQARILAACSGGRVDELCDLNFALGELFAQAALAVIAASGFQPHEIDLIGSHGQTFWHTVTPDGVVTATLQLAEPAVIAERTTITTISNFRSRDVAAGGQGAPLTGYADWLLLRHPTHWRAVQNIGGIGNVTFLPPIADRERLPTAFDTGPGNALIDSAVVYITGGRQTYDRDGLLAQSGQVDEDWLRALLGHPYYALKPPRTTGRELFSPQMARELVDQGRARGLSDASIIATLTALTAHSIADAYARFAPAPIAEVILSGGGRSNPVIYNLLQALVPGQVLSSDAIGIDGDNKEALVFAVLAYESWHNRPATLPSLTGARHSSVLGDITPGANYRDLIRRTWLNGQESESV